MLNLIYYYGTKSLLENIKIEGYLLKYTENVIFI